MSAHTCKCLETVRRNLSVNCYEGQEVELHLELRMNRKTGEILAGLPGLRYSGGRGKKKFKGHVMFQFCPFCGTRGGAK